MSVTCHLGGGRLFSYYTVTYFFTCRVLSKYCECDFPSDRDPRGSFVDAAFILHVHDVTTRF